MLDTQSTAIGLCSWAWQTLVETQQTGRCALVGAEFAYDRALSCCRRRKGSRHRSSTLMVHTARPLDRRCRSLLRLTSALRLGLDATAADNRGRASVSKGLSSKRTCRACTWQKYPTAPPSTPHRTRRVGRACRRCTPTVAKLHACLA